MLQILGVCLTFRGCYPLYVGVKWCLHGVHCEPMKSSLHPSPKTGTSWVASNWMELFWRQFCSPKTSQAAV